MMGGVGLHMQGLHRCNQTSWILAVQSIFAVRQPPMHRFKGARFTEKFHDPRCEKGHEPDADSDNCAKKRSSIMPIVQYKWCRDDEEDNTLQQIARH